MTSKENNIEDNDWLRPDKPSRCTYQLGQPISESPHSHHIGTTSERPKILPDILNYIHDTPMVKINNITRMEDVKCHIFAKCEFFNPGGSIKDRIALKMVEDAEKSGRLKPGCTIIEPTSGNTGIGLAMVAAVKGYKCIIVMPEKMSNEKVDVLKALGAEIVRTPTSAAFDHPDSNIRVAEKMVKEMPNAVLLNQYVNPANPVAHYDRTAVEILDAFDGKLDMVVCAAGTGGTITGVARKIKENCPTCKVIGVDPFGSILAEPEHLNVTTTTFYEVEGIGYDFLPTVFERKYVDKWYKSADKPSFSMARKLIKYEGLLCGGSSGAAMYCALRAVKDFNFGADKKVVVILPDSIRNYMTKFLNDDWLKMRGLHEIPDLISSQKWRNEKISTLIYTKAMILSPDTTVKYAVGMMKSQHADFAVVASEFSILGTIDSKSILDSIMKGNSDIGVARIMNTKFKTLKKHDTLANLCKLLESEPYVLIMDDDEPINPEFLTDSVSKKLKNVKRPSTLLGYLKCSQIANYLINNTKK